MNGSKNWVMSGIFMIIAFSFTSAGFSHCEIPCGIYNDAMRMDMIAEDIQTVEKAMKEIMTLSEQKEKNYNQLVRWIVNKDEHSTKIQETVWQYFMTQRIQPVASSEAKDYKAYVEKLSLLHQMLVYAMKSKQTTDLENVRKLRELLASFRTAYTGGQGKGGEPGHRTGKEEHGHSH